MTTKDREELVIQMDPEILYKLREIAQTEGHQIEVLVDEALADLIEKRKQPRANVMGAYQSSLEKFGSLYKRLAK